VTERFSRSYIPRVSEGAIQIPHKFIEWKMRNIKDKATVEGYMFQQTSTPANKSNLQGVGKGAFHERNGKL